jgi:hypothetical protein
VRVAYQISDRSGSSFRRDRDAIFYSAGPPAFAQPPLGTPQSSLETFEQFDLADRLQHEGTARVNFMIAEIADLAFAGSVRDDDYESRYGLRSARAWDANVELNVQPSPAFDVYAFGSAEWRRRALDTIDSVSPTGTDFAPGGPVFPFDNAWATRSRTRSFAAGAGISTRPFARLELRGDYSVLVSRERISYAFASPGALAPGVSAQDAGTRFPDLRNTDHVLDASARIDLTDRLAARLLYRFQRSQVANFHQTGLVPRIGHALYLGHVDGDFTAHVIGGTLQVHF